MLLNRIDTPLPSSRNRGSTLIMVVTQLANVSFIKPLMEKGIVVISWLRKGCCRLGRPIGRQGAPTKKGGLSSHDHNWEGALHFFLHLEIDVAARERIHIVGRCGARGDKGIHVQFCTCKARIETVCHQAEDEYEPIFRIIA